MLFPGIHKVCCRDMRTAITPSTGSLTNQQSRNRETLYTHWTLKQNKLKKHMRDKRSRLLHLMWHVAMATPMIDKYSGCC